jgi:hypothetical protein
MIARGVAASDARRAAANALGDKAQGKPPESQVKSPEQPAKSPELETKSPELEAKPAEPPKPDKPATPSEKAADKFGSDIAKGESPRAAAAAAQKKLDEDYEFARASDVRNAGEDLKGSARHKVNRWKNLEDAEKNGTAAELITRDQLLKNEPHNLFVHADRNPLTALAMHYTLKAFPAKPGTGKRGDFEKDRKQYLEAYQSVKEKAEELAKTRDSGDVVKAIGEMQSHVFGLIKQLRGQKSDDSIGRATATDMYNQTANDLVDLHKSLATNWRANKTGVAGRTNEFGKAAKERYGDLSVENIAEHAKDVMDGKSLNVTFGREKKSSDRFDPSEMYVKIATRTGGRDLSSVTSDANKATKHMVESMGLRGVQWGNSVTDDERKHHAAKAVEALTDLADALGLHPKDIALDGNLGLAIGARGRGGAVAHYEPDTHVVNLTRASGVGSLAHEWGHGFDHALNDYNNSRFMSDDTDTHTIKQKGGRINWESTTSDPEHMTSMGYIATERSKSGIRKAMADLASAQKDYRSRLYKFVDDNVSGRKQQAYWKSEKEIFARTFERYVQHKLESEGKKNTYLAGIETKGHKFDGFWPTDDEVKAMAPAFDNLFEEYRKHKHGSADPVKYSRAEAISAFTPVLIDRYIASADDLWLDEDSVVDRYEWVESNHSRNPAGSAGGIGGQFRSTKLRDLPSTDTLRGVDQSHDFHHSKLPPDLQKQALTWSAELHRLVGQPMNTNYDEQLAKDAGRPMTPEQVQQLKEQRWKSVDKNEVRKLLDQMNQMDKQAKLHGIDLASHVNASRLIPPELAMRLSGGRRFFDPSKIKAKAAPSQAPQQQTQPQQEFKRWQDDPAKMAEYERRKGLTPNQPKPPVDFSNRLASLMDRRDPDGISTQPVDQSNRVTPGTVVQNKNRPNHIINKNLASHINGDKKAIAATPEPEPEQSSFSPTQGLSSQSAGKVDRAAADTVGDGDQSKIDHFKGLIMDAWKIARDNAQEHNSALNTLQNLAGGPTFAARLSQHLARGGDVASVQGFDTVVDHARRHFPHLVGGADDAESGVVDMFRKGIQQVPQPWHDDVIDQAVQMAPQGFFDEYVPSAANAPDDEPVPFSVVADCRHFVQCYWMRSIKDYYAGKSQMSFNWDESAHPRASAGTHEGGQFVSKKKDGQRMESLNPGGSLKVRGTTQDVQKCDRCGRQDLKKTIVVEHLDADGNGTGHIEHFGSECISKIMKKPAVKIEKEAAAADHEAKMIKEQNAERLAKRPASTKNEANANYRKTNRHILASYFGEKDGQFVRIDGKDPADVKLFTEAGFKKASEPVSVEALTPSELQSAKQNYAEWVKPKPAKRDLPDGHVEQPRAKAGGETSDVDGKFYKGGELMPVHGLFSGQEKLPAKPKKFDGSSPTANTNEDGKGVKSVRERSEQEIADAKHRQKRMEEWTKFRNSPIGKALHLKDHPHHIKWGHGVLDTWLSQAQIVGDDWMRHAADEGKRLLLEQAGKESRTQEGIEWAVENVENEAKSNLYMKREQKKLAKQFPNALRAREYLNWFDSEEIERVGLQMAKYADSQASDKYSIRHHPMHAAAPTEAQKEAGNYRMSHIKLQGLDITIETPKGRSRRPGWPTMKAHYGYFKRSEGADGDHVDCFVGPNREADTVYVIDQVKPNGKFDECKCLVGFSSRESAIAAYRGSYTIGWRVGRVTPMKMADFKKWLASEKTKEPVAC